MPNTIHQKSSDIVGSQRSADTLLIDPQRDSEALGMGHMARTTHPDVVEREPLKGRSYGPTPTASIPRLPQNIVNENHSRQTSPLKILLLHDNRPGHYHQSEGIVEAIRRLVPVEIHRVEVKNRTIVPRRLLYKILNSERIPVNAIRYFADRVGPISHSPDLIVSAGGRTLLLNALLAKRYGCENIFSGSLRDLNPSFFSAVLLQYPRYRNIPNYIVGLKPNPVDPDKPSGNTAASGLCILVGGPSGTHSYTDSEWEKLVGFIRDAACTEKVTALTSPRTPSNITAKLKLVAAGLEKLSVVDFNEVGPGSAFQFCLEANAICVTEDSNSMITEAVCARKPVITFAPKLRRMNADEIGYLENLEKLNWIRRVLLDDRLSPDHVRVTLDSLRPLQVNHLDLLAAQLADKLSNLQLDWRDSVAIR